MIWLRISMDISLPSRKDSRVLQIALLPLPPSPFSEFGFQSLPRSSKELEKLAASVLIFRRAAGKQSSFPEHEKCVYSRKKLQMRYTSPSCKSAKCFSPFLAILHARAMNKDFFRKGEWNAQLFALWMQIFPL